MKTAKDLAFKAFKHNIFHFNNMKFESWWTEYYSKQEHEDSFEPELSVFIDGKRYIQAE